MNRIVIVAKKTFIVAFFFGSTLLGAQDADEIIKRMDQKQTFDTLKAQGTMVSANQFGEKKSDYITYSRKSGDFRIEFTNSEQAGEVVLRIGDQIYLYYPDAENVLRISGSSLKNSVFGDVSYEDLTEGNNTLKNYTAELLGEEASDGKECWKIELVSKKRRIAYPRQILWIDKILYYAVKGEYYSRSGKLLKETRITEIKELGDRLYPTQISVTDKLRKNSSTKVTMVDIEINPDISKNLFSRNSLR